MNRFTLLFFTCVCSLLSYGQGIESNYETLANKSHKTYMNSLSVTPNSPQASSFGTYGEYPVSLYTGAVDISIPIAAVPGKKLSMPINLNYNSGGVRVNALPSWVGSGWDLSLGGVITCSIDGRPDNKANYYSRSTDIDALKTNPYTNYWTQRQKLFEDAAKPPSATTLETQPDGYTLTFPGGGAKFYILPTALTAASGSTPSTISASSILFKKVVDYKVTPYFDATGKIDSFLVRDGEGRRYHYTAYEETTSTPDAAGGEAPIGIMTYRSAWFLTKMESYDKTEVITFSFASDATSFSIPMNQFEGDGKSVPVIPTSPPRAPCGGGNLCSAQITDVYGGISSVTVKNKKTLSQVNYYLAGSLNSRYIFNYSKHTGTNSHDINKLDNITVSRGTVPTGVGKTSFTYSNSTGRLTLEQVKQTSFDGSLSLGTTSFSYDPTVLPELRSNAIDFWGYYNGATSNAHLVPNYEGCQGGEYYNGAATRSANSKSLAGSLKRITYPTGGYTEFTFEPHTVEQFGGCGSPSQGWRTTAGGLRIKQVTSYSDADVEAYSKTYSYKLAGSTASSGKLLTAFQLGTYERYTRNSLRNFDPCSSDNASFTCTFLKIYASPQPTRGSVEGEHVGYSRVTETFAGSTVYTFRNQQSGRLTYTPSNGELLRIEKLNAAGTKVQQIDYTYGKDESDTRRDKTFVVPVIVPSSNQDNLEKLCMSTTNPANYTWLMSYDASRECGPNTKLYSAIQNTKYTISPYNLKQYWGYMKSVTTTDYLENGSGLQAVSRAQTFTYGDLAVTSPTIISFKNSDNATTELRFKFITSSGLPSFMGTDTKNTMTSMNLITAPIEVVRYQGGVAVDGTQMDYSRFGGTIPYLSTIYRLETTWDGAGTFKNSGTGYGWSATATINSYSKGQIENVTKRGWVPTSYTYTRGLLSSSTTAGMIQAYAYDKFNLLWRETGVDGLRTFYTYDSGQRLDKVLSYSKTFDESTTSKGDYHVVTDYSYLYHGTSDTKNYIKTEQEFTSVTGSALTSLKTNVRVDGLGRTVQTVKIGYSPAGKDIVASGVLYNSFNQPYRQLSSKESTYPSGFYIPNSFVTEYTETIYENSPLVRPLSVTPPEWATTNMVYQTNSAEIKVDGATYAANTLYITGEIDPTGASNKWRSLTYTDKLGRVIMKRRTDGTTNLDTRYGYDAKDRVSFILPPSVTVKSSTLAFRYLYDGRDNVIEKYVPDQGTTLLKYNNRDLLTFSQDPNMRTATKWMQYEYDDLGRERKNGFVTTTVSSGASVLTYAEVLSETTYDGTKAIEKGKITSHKTKVLGSSPAVYLTRTYTYDDYGRVTKTSENNTAGGSDVNEYTYDWAGNVLSEERSHTRTGTSVVVLKEHIYDWAGRKDLSYLTVTRDGTVTEPKVLVSDNDYTYRDELKTLKLGKHSGQTAFLQQIDYTYNQLSFLTKINDGSLAAASTATTFCAPLFPVGSTSTTLNDRDLFALQLYYRTPRAQYYLRPAHAKWQHLADGLAGTRTGPASLRLQV